MTLHIEISSQIIYHHSGLLSNYFQILYDISYNYRKTFFQNIDILDILIMFLCVYMYILAWELYFFGQIMLRDFISSFLYFKNQPIKVELNSLLW